jgi:uncharacterized protein YegL
MSLLNTGLDTLKAGSNYKFSATKIKNLGASEYTLATIVVDTSSSVTDFAAQLEQTVKTVFKACDKSPRRDNLMLRLTQFNDQLAEIHGFKLLGSIKEDDYNGVLNVGGMTALFDAMDEAVSTTATYGKQLTGQDYFCNAIVFVITDGQNNRGSIMVPDAIAKSVANARKAENLQSILVILVGVTNDDNQLDAYLQDVKDKAGVSQYVSIGKATPGKLAKLAEFVSQSISSTSTALGSGTPSQPINSFKF